MQAQDVLIAGGGPVGLTLAIALGQQGVKVTLVERRVVHSNLPKMERCHPRTMEIFRSLGIADQVRAIGYPQDGPFDVFLISKFSHDPIATIKRPSCDDVRLASHERNDGAHPAEPAQVVSQYALEPLLRRIAESTPNVTVVFDCALESFVEQPDGVTAKLLHGSGATELVEATYLVGADGGASTVRQALGIRLEGEPNVRDLCQALFRCDELFNRIPNGVHYYRCDERWSFLITQGDTKTFSLHAEADDPSEMPRLFEEFVGFPVKYETLYTGKWTMRLMLAERYASHRVFLAGDSAHLVTPIGGLGMNTGIGDAADLAWKLVAMIKGWGGPHLLASYEAERRPVGMRNVKTSERAYIARVAWRNRCSDDFINVDNPTPEQIKARADLGNFWISQHLKGSQNIGGIIMGYRYRDSNIVCPEPDDDGADQASFDYVPCTLPGARIPHCWLPDGAAIQDRICADFVLICTEEPPPEVEHLRQALMVRGARFSTLNLGSAAKGVKGYDRSFILVRPDLHVCWRGDQLPSEPAGIVARICGDIAPVFARSEPFIIDINRSGE